MALKYPQWQEPLAAAILEFNPQQLPGKVQRAEEAIVKRIEELALEQGDQRERLALSDGLFVLQNVKKDRLGVLEEKVRLAPNVCNSEDKFSDSTRESNSAHKMLKARVRTERIEARPQQDTWVKALFVTFFKPSNRLVRIS